MRYTRYDYSRYNKMKFLISAIVISALSIGGGLFAINSIFNGDIPVFNKAITSDNSEKISDLNITVIQCGYYSNKENADKCVDNLKSYCKPFIIEENSKFRVITGIYTDKEAEKQSDEFENNKIETTKKKFCIKNNKENIKYIELLNGIMAINSKMREPDVKSIKSTEFKKWADSIMKNVYNDDSELRDIKRCIDNMPEEITKDNISEINSSVYKIISEK